MNTNQMNSDILRAREQAVIVKSAEFYKQQVNNQQQSNE